MTLIIIVSIVMILIIIPVAVYSTARSGKQFTFVGTGEIKFVVKGESFQKIIFDVPGLSYNEDADVLYLDTQDTHKEKPKGFLEKHFGIYYVSLFYPVKKIHVWFFEWDKFVQSDKSSDYETQHRAEWVDSLYWEFAYPVNAHGVELRDGLKVDIKTRVILRIIRPRYLTFFLKGKWFPNAITSVKSLINDFGKSLDIKEIMDPKKSGSKKFKKFFEKEQHRQILNGAVQIVEASMESFEQVGTEEEKAALQKIKISELKKTEEQNLGEAEGNKVREQKRGEADGELLVLQAKATGLGKIREALGDDLTEKQLEAEKVRGFKGQALSLGSSAQQVLVPIETKKEEEKKDKK